MTESDTTPKRTDDLDPAELAALLAGAEERRRQPAVPDEPEEIRARLDPDWPGYRAAETDREPEPKHGDHGTCAERGGGIEFIDPRDGQPGIWHHTLAHMPADHDARLGRPA